MRNAALIIVSFIIGLIALSSVMTITGRNDRRMELTGNLSTAVEKTVSMLLADQKYDVADQEEFVADMTENLSQVLDSDCDITVNVMEADVEKGVLAVRVTAEYKHPNGNPGTIACERTVVFDRKSAEEPRVHTVKFYVEQGGQCYKRCKIYDGECAAIPTAPQSDRGRFDGWFDTEGHEADFSQPVTQDMTYYARWS